uniref:protein-tyrosine-phosphatase n=1 Tax=Trichuris muris TaxID=70415 RepID=A0A5S6Q871_TRIMR
MVTSSNIPYRCLPWAPGARVRIALAIGSRRSTSSESGTFPVRDGLTPFRVDRRSGGLMNVPTRFCRRVTSTNDGDVVKDEAESKSWSPSASLSQPCLPVSNVGPTKILPFLYLGSQQDAMDQELLKKNRIDYVLNMSVASPKPEFLQEEHFLRIPVNDSYSEKLLPYFDQAFRFVDNVRNMNANVLVHCLAGISRSPTLVIACVMRYLRMSSEEAYRYVKDKRPTISPNFNFLGQLLEFEKNLKSISLADDNGDGHFVGLPPFTSSVGQSKECRSGLRAKFGTLRTGCTSKELTGSVGTMEDTRVDSARSRTATRKDATSQAGAHLLALFFD